MSGTSVETYEPWRAWRDSNTILVMRRRLCRRGPVQVFREFNYGQRQSPKTVPCTVVRLIVKWFGLFYDYSSRLRCAYSEIRDPTAHVYPIDLVVREGLEPSTSAL